MTRARGEIGYIKRAVYQKDTSKEHVTGVNLSSEKPAELDILQTSGAVGLWASACSFV